MKRKKNPWREMRALHLKTYPECRVCGLIDKSNHVHHLRYRGERGKSEQPGDLVTLCEADHNEFHRLYGRSGFKITDALAWLERARADYEFVVALELELAS